MSTNIDYLENSLIKTNDQLQPKEENIHILVVDDDQLICNALSNYLEKSGYITYRAYDSQEALDIIKQNTIHVVITDIMLPGMNGLELTDTIKKNYDIDVMVITGFSENFSYEDAIIKGASDFVFKPVRFEELILRLKRVLRERLLRIERIQMLKILEQLAITDGLTRLYNSRHFYNQLKLEVTRSSRYSHPLSLLMIDIDHFKQYNDQYGHMNGDKVLSTIGKLIKGCLREMDSAYRYGGEEFTIILPETKGDEAIHVAQRIRKIVEAEKFYPEKNIEVGITISVGVTQYSKNEDIKEFIKRADKAMYMSKQLGRNRITILYAHQCQ